MQVSHKGLTAEIKTVKLGSFYVGYNVLKVCDTLIVSDDFTIYTESGKKLIFTGKKSLMHCIAWFLNDINWDCVRSLTLDELKQLQEIK